MASGIMIAGATWPWWVGFHLAVVALLVADALLTRGRESSQKQPSALAAWLWTGVLALAAGAFALWIALRQGPYTALEFVSGYVIETSLSIDNLFVFLVIFRSFGLSLKRQRSALGWGVAGAIALRALFIAAGVSLLNRFAWVTYLFGAILLYAAWRLLRGEGKSKGAEGESGPGRQIEPGPLSGPECSPGIGQSAGVNSGPGAKRSGLPAWILRLNPSLNPPKGLNPPATVSLFAVILVVEATDVLFAIDSIPAVLAVTRNPFVVYTSNIAAILGLRALYFALAGLLERFRYLHYGLGALLGFVALKMLAARWIEIPIGWSLATMAAILGICAALSLAAPSKPSGNKPAQNKPAQMQPTPSERQQPPVR